MYQAIIRKGQVVAQELPAPLVSQGSVLIKVVSSCISTGTEISGMVASGRSFISKAIEQPDKVRKAVKKLQTDGPIQVLKKVKEKTDKDREISEAGIPTGYSIAGIVLAVGDGVTKFKQGDHVAAAGAGYANHAEFVDVPQNLVMAMPKTMKFEHASTVTLGGIALQGVRRADLKLGEFCVVIGAGILGLIALQLLKVSGVRVIVVDLNEKRLQLASKLGAEVVINPLQKDPVEIVEQYTGSNGADSVLFMAATNQNEPLSQAFKMCKKKGRVVLVGVAGNEIKRQDMYTKELDFMVSTSYGPGRYDKNYEEKGLDYPYAYVRWTENRNMEEYLRLVNSGQINLDDMISASYPIDRVSEAFQALSSDVNKPLMILLNYGMPGPDLDVYVNHKRMISVSPKRVNKQLINLAMVGAGGFASAVHLPNIAKLNEKYNLHAVMDRTGLTAQNNAQKYQAVYATTDYNEILNDKDIDLVMICTRHDSHARMVLEALKAGKHVFVEKPLATTPDDLQRLVDFYHDGNNVSEKPILMVGYNRRFSRYAQEIRKHTRQRINPLFIHYRMNAGYIPSDSWIHEDGGRMVGEVCHIIDLITSLTGAGITGLNVESLTPKNERYTNSDNKSIILTYDEGSIATIEYFSVGSPDLPKEYMEVHFDEKSIIMDNYKSLKGYGIKIDEISTSVSEKGHFEELQALYDAITAEPPVFPIHIDELFQTTESTLVI